VKHSCQLLVVMEIQSGEAENTANRGSGQMKIRESNRVFAYLARKAVLSLKSNSFAIRIRSLVPYTSFSCFFLQENELRKALIPFVGVSFFKPSACHCGTIG